MDKKYSFKKISSVGQILFNNMTEPTNQLTSKEGDDLIWLMIWNQQWMEQWYIWDIRWLIMNNDVKYVEVMTDGTMCEMLQGFTMKNYIRGGGGVKPEFFDFAAQSVLRPCTWWNKEVFFHIAAL